MIEPRTAYLLPALRSVGLRDAASTAGLGCLSSIVSEVESVLFSEDLLAQLGFEGTSFEIGTWWCVPHEKVTIRSGRLFSKKPSPGDGRRVVLASEYGPNATVFARSASVVTKCKHAAHDHRSDEDRCRIDRDGWVNLTIPVTVPIEFLGMSTFSCEEPEESGLFALLEKALRF